MRKYPDLRPVIKNIPDTKHFLYGYEKDITMTENNLAMYIQIIDQSNIKLYDMVEKMGGKLIARKVDCAIVHYSYGNVPNFKEESGWGSSRKCSIPKFTHTQEIISKNYELNIKDWKDHNINDSDNWE
jgi:hypothetical protein